MKRKGELMRSLYGVGPGLCMNCIHFLNDIRVTRGRRFAKCEVYGITASEASDWRAGEIACGMYNQKYTGDRPVIHLVKRGRADGECDGQLKWEWC